MRKDERMIATIEHPPAIIRPSEWKVRLPTIGTSEEVSNNGSI
jgi:hypothetical protein